MRVDGQKLETGALRLLGQTDWYDLSTPISASVSMDHDVETGQVFMHVCMCVCVYVCMYVCVHVYMYICILV